MKLLIVSFMLLAPLMMASAAGCPNVRLSVIRQEECQKCALFISETPPVDGYRVVLRLVNESAKPVIVYGFKYEDEFQPTGYLLRQSTDTCKWKYPNGDETTLAWNEEAPEFKSKYLLAAGKSLEIAATFNRFELGHRYKRTAFVASESGQEPCEIASEEFLLIEDKTQGSAQALAPCQPNCTLSLAQVPALHGLKLRMSVDEVLALYPDFEVKPIDKFDVRWASLSVHSGSAYKAILPDVFSVDLHFLKDSLAQIEISYWATGQSKAEFQAEKISLLGLTNVWQVGQEVFECENFEVRADASPLPRIIIIDKAAQKILQKRVADSYTKPWKKSKPGKIRPRLPVTY